MSVLDRLASALGRRDEVPNQELARALAASGDTAAIAELAGALGAATAAIQGDAIKTLYEIGALRPELIAPHLEVFFAALKSRNNRLVWGAMTAIDAVAAVCAERIGARLPEILDAAERGSVIAKDHCVGILASLASQPHGPPQAWAHLLGMVRVGAVNQTPMYAEAALRAAPANDPRALEAVVRMRLEDIHHPPKRARLEKVLRKLSRMKIS